MNKPDKQLNIETLLVPKEGQLGCLSGDKQCSGCPSLSFQTEEEMVISFQNLYKKHYGILLPYVDALEEGMNLIRLMQYLNPELDNL